MQFTLVRNIQYHCQQIGAPCALHLLCYTAQLYTDMSDEVLWIDQLVAPHKRQNGMSCTHDTDTLQTY